MRLPRLLRFSSRDQEALVEVMQEYFTNDWPKNEKTWRTASLKHVKVFLLLSLISVVVVVLIHYGIVIIFLLFKNY